MGNAKHHSLCGVARCQQPRSFGSQFCAEHAAAKRSPEAGMTGQQTERYLRMCEARETWPRWMQLEHGRGGRR